MGDNTGQLEELELLQENCRAAKAGWHSASVGKPKQDAWDLYATAREALEEFQNPTAGVTETAIS